MIKEHENGVTIDIKVHPGSSKKGVRVRKGARIAVYVHSPPVQGRANRETIKLLSRALGVPPIQLEIIKGERSRQKTILVRDIDISKAESHLNRYSS